MGKKIIISEGQLQILVESLLGGAYSTYRNLGKKEMEKKYAAEERQRKARNKWWKDREKAVGKTPITNKGYVKTPEQLEWEERNPYPRADLEEPKSFLSKLFSKK